VAFFLVLLVVTVPLRFILDTLSLKYAKTLNGTIFTVCVITMVGSFVVYAMEHGGEWNQSIINFNRGLKQGVAEGVQYVTDVYYGIYGKYASVWEWERKDAERMIKAIQFY
jgi:hypothetical protein